MYMYMYMYRCSRGGEKFGKVSWISKDVTSLRLSIPQFSFGRSYLVFSFRSVIAFFFLPLDPTHRYNIWAGLNVQICIPHMYMYKYVRMLLSYPLFVTFSTR